MPNASLEKPVSRPNTLSDMLQGMGAPMARARSTADIGNANKQKYMKNQPVGGVFIAYVAITFIANESILRNVNHKRFTGSTHLGLLQQPIIGLITVA